MDKVKAHQSLPDLIHGSDEYRWAVGNTHVDGVAKESIYQHPMGNACDMNAAKELGNKISEFLVFSAMAMEKWPRRPKAQKIKTQQAGDGDASRPSVNPLYPSPHWQWRPGSNRWVCISCLSDSATHSNRLDKCPGKSGRMILAMNGDLGHCLHAFHLMMGQLCQASATPPGRIRHEFRAGKEDSSWLPLPNTHMHYKQL